MKCISGKHYYVTFALWHKPSVCRLSVCDVVAPSRHLNFSAIFLHLLIVQRLIQVVLKFWAKVKRRFFDQYVALFRKWCKIELSLQWQTIVHDLSIGAIISDNYQVRRVV